MADSVTILPEIVKVNLSVPKIFGRVEYPVVPSHIEEKHTPVVLLPGKPGPPGKDGSVIGGAAIDDDSIRDDRVWSSEKTHDEDVEIVDSLTPPIDLTLLFDNALT